MGYSDAIGERREYAEYSYAVASGAGIRLFRALGDYLLARRLIMLGRRLALSRNYVRKHTYGRGAISKWPRGTSCSKTERDRISGIDELVSVNIGDGVICYALSFPGIERGVRR